MKNEETSYMKGMSYEAFMRRAFQKSEITKDDRRSAAMQNAIDAETGQSHVQHLRPFEKQFEKLKNNIHNALDKYIANKKLKAEVTDTISTFKARVDNAMTTDDLMLIIHQTLELTSDIKDFR